MLHPLFYFLDFLPEPGEFPAGVDLLSDVGNLVAYHIFDGILVHPIALGYGDKVSTAIVRTVIGVQFQVVPNTLEGFLIPGVGQFDVFLVAVIGICPVE